MSHVMRKPVFAYAKNKGTDQLCGKRTADQRLCFCSVDSTIALLLKSEISSLLTIFCNCTVWFVSDLVGNTKDRFSHDEAHVLQA